MLRTNTSFCVKQNRCNPETTKFYLAVRLMILLQIKYSGDEVVELEFLNSTMHSVVNSLHVPV